MRINNALTLTRPLVGVDLETTGTNEKTDCIVQISLEIYAPNIGEPRLYSTLVNPIVPIPAGATASHGITDAHVKDAPTFRMLAVELSASLIDCDFCGKNIQRFDLPLLREEFLRAGIVWQYETAAIIEVERLWQLAQPRKLEQAVAQWGDGEDRAELGPLKAHDATSDCRWSTRVAANIANHLGMHGWSPARVHAQLFPDAFDADGKLRWLERGELALTFGPHRGVPLSRVPRGFLNWMLGKDFSAKVKNACRDQLAGRPPRRDRDDTNDPAQREVSGAGDVDTVR